MAINWDKEYGTSKTTKSKINWEKEYNPTGFKQKIDTEKADLRSQGLPVSVRDDRSAPTMGGSILRDILKVPATLLSRPAQAIASAKGFTPEEQTVKSKYLGDIKTSQNKKDVLSDVGRGLELASYGVGIGAGKNLLAQSGKQAAKQIAKRTALEGAVGGFAGSAGRVITNQSGNLKQDIKDIALGTGIGTIAGGALGYAGGRLGGKVLSAEERAMERAVGKGGKFNIPGIGTPKVTETPKIETPVNNLDPKNFKSVDEFVKAQPTLYHGSNQLETINKSGFSLNNAKSGIKTGDQPGIYLSNDVSRSSQYGKVGEFYLKPNLKIAKITNDEIFADAFGKAEKFPNGNVNQYFKKQGYDGFTIIGKKGQALGSGKTETVIFDPKNIKTKSQLTDIWNKENQAIPESSPITKTPEFKSKVTEGETVLDNHYNNPDASPGSHKLYSETVYNDIANDPERVKRIAMGSNEPTTNGVPADAYYAIAKNEAVKSGDINAIKELANSDVGTISGKKLEANKLTQEGDIVDTLRDIKKARAKAVGVSEEAIKKQETTLVGKLKTTIKGLSDNIINDLICK